MEQDHSQLMSALQQIEQSAEDVLAEKQQIVQLDRRRHQTREAMRALRNQTQVDKAWLCFGNMFIKMPMQKAKKLLDKDFNHLDDEIDETRIKLRKKVNTLRDLENKEELKGFGLTTLSKDELTAIQNII